jgi:Fic family protein
MNKSLFSTNSLGKLKQIQAYNKLDWAFVPDNLPTSMNISNEIWPLLAEAREELARLDGVGRHLPNYQLLLRPLQHREALKSSSLEGTYATPEQLLLFEMEPKNPKSPKDRVNAWLEVYNYSKALRKGQQLLTDDLPVSLRLIKYLHKQLLHRVRGHHRDPGNFRTTQVHIGSDRRFVPPPPIEALKCLNDLELYIHSNPKIDPLVFCFLVHYQFETIHPFLDGNGRVGRLLLSLMIYKWCNLNSPWLYLSAFFDRYKDEYITNLFNVSAKSDWSSWVKFCLRATTYQAKDAIQRCDKLVQLRNNYSTIIAECNASTRLNTILDSLFERPVITIPQISRQLEVSYPTAKSYVDLLEKQNILDQSKNSNRPKVFFAYDIMDIAFKDVDIG